MENSPLLLLTTVLLVFLLVMLTACITSLESLSTRPVTLAWAIAPEAKKILDAMGYIQVNLDKNLTVAQLSKRACLHQDYFSRIFYQYAGERPLTYIHAKRIERAQYLIATTNMPIAKIAEDTGFENQPYFFKIFKKITRLTPGEYVKQHRLLMSV